MFNYYSHSPGLSPIFSCFMIFLVIVMIADVALRAVSLWRAARANQLAWFIALMVINTMGILPVIYLVYFAKDALNKGGAKQSAKKIVGRKKR